MRRLAWALGLVAALAACGDSDDAVAVAGSTTAAPVATTTPTATEAPDDDGAGDAEQADSVAPGAEDDPVPPDDEPNGVDEPDPPPDQDAATTTTGPPPEPIPADEVGRRLTDGLAGAGGGDVAATEACVVTTLEADPGLSERVVATGVGGDFGDLAPADAEALAALIIGCTERRDLEAFTALVLTEIDDVPPIPTEVAGCVTEAIVGPGGAGVLVGLAGAVGLGGTDASRAAVVDAFVTCVPPAWLTEVVTAEFGDDLDFVAATDPACITAGYADDGIRRALWTSFAGSAGFDVDDLDEPGQIALLTPLFACIDWGDVLAEAAAEQDVVLGDATRQCLREAFPAPAETAALFVADDSTELEAALATCLTPTEAEALGLDP